MLTEILYSNTEINDLNECSKIYSSIKNVNNCYIYFHIGNDLNKLYKEFNFSSILDSYNYVKNIETKFNININFIDLSSHFTKLNNLLLKFNYDDIENLIQQLKNMYINAIYNYLKIG